MVDVIFGLDGGELPEIVVTDTRPAADTPDITEIDLRRS
jgi:hypothetical protein